MSDDQERARLLAQFQRRPVAPLKPELDIDSDTYTAFKAVDRKQRRLLILPVKDACEWITYQYLLRIVLDASGRVLVLIFTFMAVTLKGQNLRQIAEAVADERCDYIQQFDAKRWNKTGDPDTAFVEFIEFVCDKPAMAAAEEGKEVA